MTCVLLFDELFCRVSLISIRRSRNQQESIAVRSRNFISIYEYDTSVNAAQRHGCCVEVSLRVLSHDHEIQIVGFRSRDQFRKRASAVSAEGGVNVNDAFVIDVVAGGFGNDTLGGELLN